MRGAAALALALALALGSLPPPAARAQTTALGLSAQDNDKPIDIEADDGIEWQQNNRVYIARGDARATRGQTTLFADTMMAFYRPICSPEAIAAAAKREAAQAAEAQRPAATPTAAGKKTAAAPAQAAPANKPAAERNCPDPAAPAPTRTAAAGEAKPGAADPAGGATEIYRMEAEGNVRIATETQTIYGDHAVYDVDQSLLVVTGKHLKLETPRDTVTARDDLEWYDDKQLAVARGNAVATREGKRLAGDVLTAAVEKDEKGSSHISRIDAQGNVLVSSLEQIARGDSGVYNVDTGIATLAGRVSLTKGDNELRGQYGVVDLNRNVNRLLSAPPSAQLTQGAAPRVAGILMPRAKPAPSDAAKQGAAATPQSAATAGEKTAQ
ncbi:MAG TPA: LptA/OstA family protein [Stellaceae bacterium]|nr:LptA/OstA family protein [Stellaceae bacterium]